MPRIQEEERTYIPRQIKFQVLKDCRQKCAHCGALLTMSTATIEHIVPLSKGGSNDIENFVVLCKPCNKEKSNDIVEPKAYYPHLPKETLKRATAVFQRYIKTVRWLDYQTVFMTDRFDMKFDRVLPINPARPMPPRIIPSVCQIRKLRGDELQEALMLYTARLSAYDKELISCEEKDIATMPYYGVYYAEKLLAILSPCCYPFDKPTPIVMHEVLRPVIFIDFMPTHIDKVMHHNILNQTCILAAILREVQKTLRTFSDDVAIETIIRSPASDEFAFKAMSMLYHQYKGKYIMFNAAHGEDDDASPTVTHIACILEKHSARTLWRDDPHSVLEQDNFTTELPRRQVEIIDDLKKANAPKAAPEKMKKSDKKKLHKKTKRHNK